MCLGEGLGKQASRLQLRRVHLPTISETEEAGIRSAGMKYDNPISEDDVLLTFSKEQDFTEKKKVGHWITDLKEQAKTQAGTDSKKLQSNQQRKPSASSFPDFFPQNMIIKWDIDANPKVGVDVYMKRLQFNDIGVNCTKEYWMPKDDKIVNSWMQFFG